MVTNFMGIILNYTNIAYGSKPGRLLKHIQMLQNEWKKDIYTLTEYTYLQKRVIKEEK